MKKFPGKDTYSACMVALPGKHPAGQSGCAVPGAGSVECKLPATGKWTKTKQKACFCKQHSSIKIWLAIV
jgi:hypothetical protein